MKSPIRRPGRGFFVGECFTWNIIVANFSGFFG